MDTGQAGGSLRLSFVRGFLKGLLLYGICLGSLLWLKVDLSTIKSPAIAWTFMAGALVLGSTFSALMAPLEMTWNEHGIRIREGLHGWSEFQWDQLEVYSRVGFPGVLLWTDLFYIRFEGRRYFQISPLSYAMTDWKHFITWLEYSHSDKAERPWVFPFPLFVRK